MFSSLVERVSLLFDAPHEAIRLILGLLFTQIVSILYRLVVHQINNSFIREVLCLISGLFIAVFVYGSECYHHFLSTLGFYVIFNLLPLKVALIVNFPFQLGYLIMGYYYNNMVPDYAINWTTTQSLITLRLIGLGFDIHSTAKSDDKKECPGLFSLLGYIFFFSTYLVGPISQYERYQSFMKGELMPSNKLPPLKMGITRLLSGGFYLGLYIISKSVFSTTYLLSEGFTELNLLMRVGFITVWGHCSMYKYLGVWCVAESSCMYMGYSYEESKDDKSHKWEGLRNVATLSYHKAYHLFHIIDVWNINTNKWCLKYVYKQCRWMGSKNLSQLTTLLFLSVWHGLHPGYLYCFLQEFLYIATERSVGTFDFTKDEGPFRWVKLVLCWLYTRVVFSFALVCFELYYTDLIHQVYSSVYYMPLVAAFAIIAGAQTRLLFRKKKE